MQNMKILLIAVLLGMSWVASAQWRLGVKLVPAVTWGRIETASDTLSVSGNKGAVRLMGGIVADNHFRENYVFSTGLNFISKKYKYHAQAPGIPYNESYNLQYIQLPLSLKLYTNEIGLDTRLYFHFGNNLEFNIHHNLQDNPDALATKILFFDTSVFASTGVEFKLGTDTSLFAGFGYHRGLLDIIYKNIPLDQSLVLRSNLIGMEMGVKF